MSNKLQAIARAIGQLTYRETEELANDLRQMVDGRTTDCSPPMFDAEKNVDWMELIQDWATYQLEDK
ncbi:UNVERIFIED_ORG: hypothetical protein M2193_000064 [Bradyrhizobium japonicum]